MPGKHFLKLKMSNSLLKTAAVALLLLAFIFPAKALSFHNAAVADTTKKKPLVFPVPPADANRLFYLQRTANINTIIYDLNVDKETGLPDADEPVKAYWIRYNEKGQKENLSYIQRKFAYGIVSKKLADNKFDIRFVSYKKFPLTLMKAADGKYHIFATVSQRQMILHNLFVKIEGGSFWLPNVVYVEFKGTDPVTGKEVTERFKP